MRACHNRMGGLHFDLDNLFDHFLGDRAKSNSEWYPRAEILEGDTGYRLVLELPGVDAESVSIEMKENQLVIAGEKVLPEVEEGFTLVRRERRDGKFNRAFEFSSLVDADNVTAEFTHGLLTVNVPKSEKILPRKIQISVN